jgi:hypothetical protein
MTGRFIVGMLLGLIVVTAVFNIRKRGWRTYTMNLLIAIDQFWNAFMGGMPDETISSRCARGSGKRWYWTLLGRILDFIQPNHIEKALEHERERLQLPSALR